jgi:hypothetical protein
MVGVVARTQILIIVYTARVALLGLLFVLLLVPPFTCA